MKKFVHSRWKEHSDPFVPDALSTPSGHFSVDKTRDSILRARSFSSGCEKRGISTTSRATSADDLTGTCRVAANYSANTRDVTSQSHSFSSPARKKQRTCTTVSAASPIFNDYLAGTSRRAAAMNIDILTDDDSSAPKTGPPPLKHREDDKGFVYERPCFTYGELIQELYGSEKRSVMRMCDIIKQLKIRYPYFRTLRRLDSCVGQALHKSQRFERISPGLWRIVSHQMCRGRRNRNLAKRFPEQQRKSQTANSATDTDNSKIQKQLKKAATTRHPRDRRRPDFLSIEWRKSAKSKFGKAPTKYRDTETKSSREEEWGSSDPQTHDFDNGEMSTSSSESEVRSNTSQGDPALIEPKTEPEEPPDVEIVRLKHVLKEYNDKILKEAMGTVAGENNKYLQRMIGTLADIRARQNFSPVNGNYETEKMLEKDLREHNQKVLGDVINKIILQNKKCLEELSATSDAVNEKSVERTTKRTAGGAATTYIFRAANCVGGARNKNMSMVQCQDQKFSRVVYKSPLIPVVVSKNQSIQDSVPSQVTTTGTNLSYPLPVLDRPTHRQHNHVRYGRRVVPRLKPAPTTWPFVKHNSDSQDCEMLPEKQPNASGATSTSRKSAELSGSKKVSSTSIPKRFVTKSVEDLAASRQPGRDFVKTEFKSSVDSEFAEYARKNIELDDIVALIDPSLATSSKEKPNLTEKPASSQDFSLDSSQPDNRDQLTESAGLSDTGNCSTSNDNSSMISIEKARSDATACQPSPEKISPILNSPVTPRINSVFSKAVDRAAKEDNIGPPPAGRFVKLSPKMSTEKDDNAPEVSVRVSNRTLWKNFKINKPPVEHHAPCTGAHLGKTLNYRYIPPYRWGAQTNMDHRSHVLAPRPSVVISPRYVFYSPVQSEFARFTNPVGHHVVTNSNTQMTQQQIQLKRSDVRCRIRGARVFRFPVRK